VKNLYIRIDARMTYSVM